MTITHSQSSPKDEGEKLENVHNNGTTMAQTMSQESEEGVSEMTILKMEMEDSEMIYISF